MASFIIKASQRSLQLKCQKIEMKILWIFGYGLMGTGEQSSNFKFKVVLHIDIMKSDAH